jgi:methyl-accepting chemotaxis protein
MTIKTKLFANMLITIIGIVVIGGFSLAGMKFVQGKLSVLTEKSTPYQLKTIEFQRALQEHTSNLIKLATATSQADFSAVKGESEKTLAEIKTVATELASFKGGSDEGKTSVSVQELEGITTELLATTQERLKAEEAGRAANGLMKKKLQDVAKKLRDMDQSMKSVQKNSMGQLTTSNDSVKSITQKVKQVQAASNALNEVKVAILEISAADGKTPLTVAKSHFTVASRRLVQCELVKSDKGSGISRTIVDSMADVTKQVAASQGLLDLKSGILDNFTEDGKKQFAQTLAVVNQKLAQLTTAMGDAVERSSDEYVAEDKKFDSSVKGASSAGDIMAATSDLIALGSDISRLINELFGAATIQELEATKAELTRKFNEAGSIQARVAKTASASNKSGQAVRFNGVAGSLNEVKGLLLAKDGVAEKLLNVLNIKSKAQGLNTKLKELVAKQREEGKRGVTSAQAEQETAVKSVNTVFRTNITTVSVIGLIVLILGISVSTLLARSITTPIKALSEMAEKFGNGDFSSQLDDKRRDEFGQLSTHFNQAATRLQEITGGLRNAISNLATSSKELSVTAEELTQGAQQQANQVAQAATAMTEMNQTIHEVAQNAGSAASASTNSLNMAASGKQTVSKTVQGMEEIAQAVRETASTITQLGNSSDQIGAIVNVINEIADQTNLLALNAAIEAARAGAAGMGFAVVADEVRKLAERTTEATGEIAGMVKEIQSQTRQSVASMESGKRRVEEGVTLASEASRSLEIIVQASGQGADLVTRIATAAEEQSATAAQVSTSMEYIETITRSAEMSTQEINRAAQELARLADDLYAMAAWFKV